MEHLFISCPKFLEDLLLEELDELEVQGLQAVSHGVFAEKTMENVYLINYMSRFANRVLWPLKEFKAYDKETLYQKAREIPWELYISPNKTFSIDADVNYHPTINNSHFAALVLKDAVCDYLKDMFGSRPNIEKRNPDVHLQLYIFKDKVSIYFDTSKEPLYKRGYREKGHTAPLQENLAAAMVSLAHPSAKDVICDPFCGSGTFLMEILLKLGSIPAGKLRNGWGFEQMPEFNKEDFERVKASCDEYMSLPSQQILFGSDKDPMSVRLAKKQFEKLNASCFHLEEKPIKAYAPSSKPTLVITNPPYGRRMAKDADLLEELKKFLQKKCAPNVRTYVLYENVNELRGYGFKIHNTWSFTSGGLKLKFCQIGCPSF